MRVLQILGAAGAGGAETFFVDMVTALHRAGLDQKVVIRADAGRAEALEGQGIKPAALRFGGRLDLATKPRLRRIVADYKPDIVQSWMRRATRFVSRPRKGGRFFHVGWLGDYHRLGDFRGCDHLIGVTADIRDYLIREGWPPERVHYIPTFARSMAAPALPRATFATPEEAPLFLALGRLHERKAFDVLIRAAAGVPGAHLWIAGEGPERRALERLIAGLGLSGRVRLLGWRDDREALLAASDYCVLPSRYEPFGTVMIEAWAQDVPLIAAAADGPRGLIEDGRNGLLVPVDDTGALAAAMRRLVEEPALGPALAAGGRADFEARFTEAAVVERYLAFYRGIAAP